MADLIGFILNRPKSSEPLPSIAPPNIDDGAIIVSSPGPLATGTFLDLEGSVKNESELVTKYRDMTQHPEVAKAVNEIVNEAIVSEDGEKTVEMLLDDCPIPESLKKKMTDEFDEVLRLLEFDHRDYQIFRRWYVDGRLYYLILVDPNDPAGGIKELRYLDPRKVRKIRQMRNIKDKSKPGVVLQKVEQEFYVYSEKALSTGPNRNPLSTWQTTNNGVKIAKDAIVYVTSEEMNSQGTMILSFLHQAIKPLNCLRSMEDSCVIYRLSRAPERRVFYIDVGDMPHSKAQQYVQDIIAKHKSKLLYNAETGETQDARRFMTMLEDFYIPRREGGKSTQIETLPPAGNLGQIDDIKYFEFKLYNSLQVPVSRLNPEYAYDIGRATQINHDEVNFSKFVNRLRKRFNKLFTDVLEKQLVLKRIVTPEEWDQIKYFIRFKYHSDNDFAELKDQEIWQNRLAVLQLMDPYIGRFVSNEEARKTILRQTDEDIERNDEQIAAEMGNPQFAPPLNDMGDPMGGQEGPPMGQGGGPTLSLPPPLPEATPPKAKKPKGKK